MIYCRNNIISVADPGFPRGEQTDRRRLPIIRPVFPETAWKRRKLGQGRSSNFVFYKSATECGKIRNFDQ